MVEPFVRWRDRFAKSRENLSSRLSFTLKRTPTIDEDTWDAIEEILIGADLGVPTTMKLMDGLKERARAAKVADPELLKDLLKEEIRGLLPPADPLFETGRQYVCLLVGVNGTGKTTTLAKMAHRAKSEGRSVILAAADTYRAAAIEQLETWGSRVGVDVVKQHRGASASAVVFDAIKAAESRQADLLLVDTAGRLHTYGNLMEELAKLGRVAAREAGRYELRTLLVLDGTTGQNGLVQARAFQEALNLDGLVLTKLDGTAKGGIVVAAVDELGVPVYLVGVGEKMDDLWDFDAEAFAAALLD